MGINVSDKKETRKGEDMAEYRLGEVEMRFANLIWENEPLSSGELAKLCERELNWKKSTTYTILHRVCERELFQNKKSVVTSLVSREEFYAMQSKQFVEDSFSGSLPKFLAAFTSGSKLSKEEIEQLREIIEKSREQ